MKLQKCAQFRQCVAKFGILAIVLGLLLPLAIGNISLVSIQPTTPQSDDQFQQEIPRGQYTTVDPINITDSEDWANYAFITGTGTENDPYIIENVEIVGDDFMFEAYSIESYGIYIADEDSSFVIRDCSINNFHVGIYCLTLSSSSFSRSISNNIIDHCGIGIYTIGPNYYIDHNSLSECRALPENRKWLGENGDTWTVPYFGGAGIYAYFAMDGVIIEENHITTSDVGIVIHRHATIKNNELEDCGILFYLAYILLNEVEGNTINGLPLGFFVDLENDDQDPLVIDGDDQQYGQLVCVLCVNVIIQNLEIQDTTIGFLILHNKNLTMQNLIAQNCLLGMYLMDMGPMPDPPGRLEFIHTQDLAFRDCGCGFQMEIRGFFEEVTYDVNVTIREFTGNIYDVFLGPKSFSGMTLTVPLNTKFFIDSYNPFQLSVLYEGNPYSNVENVTSHYIPYYAPFPYSAVEVSVADLGAYKVTIREVYVNTDPENNTIIQYQPYYNITIEVQDLKPMDNKFRIPGYTGGIIGLWCSLSVVMIVLSLRKKWKFSNNPNPS